MVEMTQLQELYVNVETLSGPLPKLEGLLYCDVSKADYCRLWDVTSSASTDCNFKIVPECIPDCMVLYEWIERSPGRCCSSPGISCDQEGRIVAM
jgi:hypothetical protein